ncbi:MAG TPA: hypothetical protein VEA58_05120 [Anaerovoracaceae bacterium]|nr:hypothetical protein [Anaerovoracaceae bacterium]
MQNKEEAQASSFMGTEKSIFTKTADFMMLRIEVGDRFHGLLRKYFFQLGNQLIVFTLSLENTERSIKCLFIWTTALRQSHIKK